MYADASALVKLVVEDAESDDLRAYLRARPTTLVSSALAPVEVARAARVAGNVPQSRVDRLFAVVDLVEVRAPVLEAAAVIASESIGTLAAIHLASAQEIAPDEVLAYDVPLVEAVRARGLAVVGPGA